MIKETNGLKRKKIKINEKFPTDNELSLSMQIKQKENNLGVTVKCYVKYSSDYGDLPVPVPRHKLIVSDEVKKQDETKVLFLGNQVWYRNVPKVRAGWTSLSPKIKVPNYKGTSERQCLRTGTV
jgi:hypothetical protein